MSPEVKAMIPYDLGDEICDAAEALIREREQ